MPAAKLKGEKQLEATSARPKAAAKPPKAAFPKKGQAPKPAEFAARLPLALGKRFEAVRQYLLKQRSVSEDIYYYGPKAGWALRYLADGRPLCSLLVMGERPVGIVALDATTSPRVDWKSLSPVAQKARREAHGSPSMFWLDVPLDGPGAMDFKAILKVKLATRAAAA